jgi:hypothetical protein
MPHTLQALLDSAKWAYTTRRVTRAHVADLSHAFETAEPGDLLLARVTEINQHKSIQHGSGRVGTLYPEDLIVVAVGARYAPDQFEGIATIGADGCDLLAAGGIAGTMRLKHAKMRAPTRLEPLGLLTDAFGRVINLARYALPARRAPSGIPMIAVLGASMNSGKTTTAAHLINGLAQAGFTVGAMKITGTGAAGDGGMFTDAGAVRVLDFTDAGFGTTYGVRVAELEAAFESLAANLGDLKPDVIVVEVADGVFQSETAGFIRSATFRRLVGGVLFAAPDALALLGGAQIITDLGLPLLGLGGLATASPLATAEAQAMLSVPVYDLDALRALPTVLSLKAQAERDPLARTSDRPAPLRSAA